MDLTMGRSKLSYRKRYSELASEEPELFINPPGPVIRILTDPVEIQAVEEAQRIQLADRSLPASWATVGVVFEDQYIQVLRDAVEFPGGIRGTYIRVLPRRRGITGVAVLPLLDNKIVLLRQFRHATRAWHLEIPRGFADGNETCDQTVARELFEEIGAIPVSLAPAGALHIDTGLLNEHVALFVATIDKLGAVAETEGIESIQLVTVGELEDMIARTEVTDSFTIAGLFMAITRGLLQHI